MVPTTRSISTASAPASPSPLTTVGNPRTAAEAATGRASRIARIPASSMFERVRHHAFQAHGTKAFPPDVPEAPRDVRVDQVAGGVFVRDHRGGRLEPGHERQFPEDLPFAGNVHDPALVADLDAAGADHVQERGGIATLLDDRRVPREGLRHGRRGDPSERLTIEVLERWTIPEERGDVVVVVGRCGPLVVPGHRGIIADVVRRRKRGACRKTGAVTHNREPDTFAEIGAAMRVSSSADGRSVVMAEHAVVIAGGARRD